LQLEGNQDPTEIGGDDTPFTDGGYAEFMTVSDRFVYRIPNSFTNTEAAPLLCAGAIGYRSLHLTGLVNGQRLGLTGPGGIERRKNPRSKGGGDVEQGWRG